MVTMRQIFVHLSRYYIDDLMNDIQSKIEEMNQDSYFIKDYKFSGLEKNEGNAHAVLLFEGKN